MALAQIWSRSDQFSGYPCVTPARPLRLQKCIIEPPNNMRGSTRWKLRAAYKWYGTNRTTQIKSMVIAQVAPFFDMENAKTELYYAVI